FSLVPESVGGGADVTENSISWSVSQASLLNAAPGYNIVTSMEDPACAMPFANNGAYTDLEQFGILPIDAITGDTVSYSAFSGQNFNFFGESFVGGFNFTDDGFVYFNSTPGSNPWVNLPIPDVSDPNSLIAVLWRDMVIPTPNRTPGSFVGVSLASAGPNLTIIEYDNMEAWPGGGGDSIDFAVAIRGEASDAPGVFEIMMGFDNINTSDSTGTIGVENANGNSGAQFAFNNVNIVDGMAICYDLVGAKAEPVILTYQVTVDESAGGSEVVSELTNDVDSIGSKTVTNYQTVNVENTVVRGDWDGDGDVDINDVRALTRAIQFRETIDMAFDLNNDGIINALDTRTMMTLCTRARCAA
ncbi:MAG: dockerin type I domain-containing protein, partial [Paraglaciecola sp.]|nr:dockerin type I domain-containing protein [Paraglaciecola sp.]